MITAWNRLTALPEKRAAYSLDSNFREGLFDLGLNDPERVAERLHDTALVLFKPDAIASRKVGLATAWLAERHFYPTATAMIRFSGSVVHALWQYQSQRNTLDKIRLYSNWSSRFPALLVALRRCHSSTTDIRPASVVMKAIKGAAAVGDRDGSDLRSYMGSPNPVLNFVHSADEPADIVRELPVFLESHERRQFIHDLIAGNTTWGETSLRADVENLESIVPYHDMNPIASAARLQACIKSSHSLSETCTQIIDEVVRGEAPLDLALLEPCLVSNTAVNPMDVFVFGTAYVGRNLSGAKGLIDGDCVRAWDERTKRRHQ